jgi:MFS family permease
VEEEEMWSIVKEWRKQAEPWYSAIGLANLVVGTSSVLVPLMVVQVLHGTVENVGLISSLASLMGVIGSLIWGRLSDAAHRRKPFVIMSYIMVSVSFVGIALVSSFTWMLVINMILNLFWVANASVSVLLVIENREESLWESRISHLNQIGTIGWVSGLAFGSVALAVASPSIGEATAIRLVFGVLSFGGLLSAVLATRTIPITTPRFTRRRFRGSLLALGNLIVERARYAPFHIYHRFNPSRLPALLWGEGGLRHETKLFLVAMLLAFTAFGFFFVPLPILLADAFGIASSSVFFYYVVLNSAIVIAYPLAARRIKRLGNKSVLTSSLLARVLLFTLGAAFLFVTLAKPSRVVMALFFFVMGLSWSFFQLSSVVMISRLARPEYRGQALGLYNAVAGLGTIVAGISSGSMAQHLGYAATTTTAAVLAGVAMAIVWSLRIPRRATEQKPESQKPKLTKPHAQPASQQG